MPGRCTIGVDLGGTKLLAGVVDEELRVLARVRRPIRGLAREELYAVVAEAVSEVVAAAGDDVVVDDVAGIGIPSLIDRSRGVSVSSVHLPLDEAPFEADMRALLGREVAVDNDANCHTLGEWRAGAAAGCSDVVLLTLGTGIGGGLVLGGALYRGAQGAGAELGHLVVDLDGPACFDDCPNHGCLEALCSGSALERDATAALADHPSSVLADTAGPLTGELIVGAAHVGDEFAVSVLADLGRRLGAGLAGIVNTFNPEVVVVGGGLMAAGELILGPAREEMVARALASSRDFVRIVAAELGPDAGFIGAALLARGADR
jgi:glucokinase